MPAKLPRRFTVTIRKGESRWYIASSEQCPGLIVANADRDQVLHKLPDAIRLIYLAQFQKHVEVRIRPLPREGSSKGKLGLTLKVPVEISSAARAG